MVVLIKGMSPGERDILITSLSDIPRPDDGIDELDAWRRYDQDNHAIDAAMDRTDGEPAPALAERIAQNQAAWAGFWAKRHNNPEAREIYRLLARAFARHLPGPGPVGKLAVAGTVSTERIN